MMKVLALATVLLLPGSLVAGLLGMNMIIPLPDDDPMRWLVVGSRLRNPHPADRPRPPLVVSLGSTLDLLRRLRGDLLTLGRLAFAIALFLIRE